MDLEARLFELGFEFLPPPLQHPKHKFVNATVAGGLLYVAGQISRNADGSVIFGKVGGPKMRPEMARAAARRCVVDVLAAAASAVPAERIYRVADMLVFVASEPFFTDMPYVADGASELLLEIFGAEAGLHSRTAIGVAGLPQGASVEIKAVVELI